MYKLETKKMNEHNLFHHVNSKVNHDRDLKKKKPHQKKTFPQGYVVGQMFEWMKTEYNGKKKNPRGK